MSGLTNEYAEFRGENRTIKDPCIPPQVILLNGYPENAEQSLLSNIHETFKLPILLQGNKYALERIQHGLVFGVKEVNNLGIEAIMEWTRRNNLALRLVDCVDSVQTIQQINRNFFKSSTGWFFQKAGIAETFYHFSDICTDLSLDHVIVAGACTYYYWGGWPLWDIDTVVASSADLEAVAKRDGRQVQSTSSTVGKMNYVDCGEVDVVSDLILSYYEGGNRVENDFSFSELIADAQTVRLFGEGCLMTSAEMTVVMKFYMGRFGKDPWGVPKDDYEDGIGVLFAQGLNFGNIFNRAKRLGIEGRVIVAADIASEVFGIKL